MRTTLHINGVPVQFWSFGPWTSACVGSGLNVRTVTGDDALDVMARVAALIQS